MGGIAKPTFTDLVIRAVAKALREHPQMNSQFQTDAIELMQEVHVGLAVAVPEGLLVPVIRNADQLPFKRLRLKVPGWLMPREKARWGWMTSLVERSRYQR